MEKETNDPIWYQQGDVLIKPVDEIPEDAAVIEGRILAEGEATGHKHLATAPDVRLFIFESTIYMRVPYKTEIVHEEHRPIDIPAGDYTIGIVREFDHFAEEKHVPETRNVVD
jgi:hypothetical protein